MQRQSFLTSNVYAGQHPKPQQGVPTPKRKPLHYHYFLTEGNSSPSFPYFPTFSADPKRRDDLRHVFPISLHLVLTVNVDKVFALLSLFPYIWCRSET